MTTILTEQQTARRAVLAASLASRGFAEVDSHAGITPGARITWRVTRRSGHDCGEGFYRQANHTERLTGEVLTVMRKGPDARVIARLDSNEHVTIVDSFSVLAVSGGGSR